jgi:hypothetical protein
MEYLVQKATVLNVKLDSTRAEISRTAVMIYILIFFMFNLGGGARCNVVVKALRYKPEGRGFETR